MCLYLLGEWYDSVGEEAGRKEGLGRFENVNVSLVILNTVDPMMPWDSLCAQHISPEPFPLFLAKSLYNALSLKIVVKQWGGGGGGHGRTLKISGRSPLSALHFHPYFSQSQK